MSTENVKKFYDLLNGSDELQEELLKREKDYAETHDEPSDNASDTEIREARLAAVKDIVLPLAKEHGMEFTVDDVIEYEEMMLDDIDMEVDDSVLANAAGGEYEGIFICPFLGIGHKDDDHGWCYGPGLAWFACFIKGV